MNNSDYNKSTTNLYGKSFATSNGYNQLITHSDSDVTSQSLRPILAIADSRLGNGSFFHLAVCDNVWLQITLQVFLDIHVTSFSKTKFPFLSVLCVFF